MRCVHIKLNIFPNTYISFNCTYNHNFIYFLLVSLLQLFVSTQQTACSYLGIMRGGVGDELSCDFPLNANMSLKLCELGNIEYEQPLLSLLDMSACSLWQIDERINQFPLLTTLIYKINDVTYVADLAFHRLTDLQALCLSENQIQSIAQDALNGLNNLLFLDLSNNNIQFIEAEWFNTITRLRTLNLRDNEIKSIHADAFVKSVRLTKLMLSNNLIQKLE